MHLRDRITGSWGEHQKLSYEQKVRLLNGMDRLGADAGLATTWTVGARGAVAEALFAPQGGRNQVSLPNPRHPTASGRPGRTRLDGFFEAGRRAGNAVKQWLELKSDRIHESPERALAAARAYAREGLMDWHALKDGAATASDGIVIHFVRKPAAGAEAGMLKVLFGAESPFSAVRFGDGPWIERPDTAPMPALPPPLKGPAAP